MGSNPSSSRRPHRLRGGILRSLLGILGLLTLLVLCAIAGVCWYAQIQIDRAGGWRAYSGQLASRGLEWLQPRLDPLLAPQDRLRLSQATATLPRVAPGLDAETWGELAVSMESLARKIREDRLTEQDARAFVDELARLLAPPSDVLDSESTGP